MDLYRVSVDQKFNNTLYLLETSSIQMMSMTKYFRKQKKNIMINLIRGLFYEKKNYLKNRTGHIRKC